MKRRVLSGPTVRIPALAVAAALCFALLPAAAHAHDGVVLRPHEVAAWQTWLPQPLPFAAVLIAAWIYHRLQTARSGRTPAGRGDWRPAAFYAGLLCLALALASPLDRMAATLLAAHMAQHLLLVGIAAPLLVLGAPVPLMLRAMPRSAAVALSRLRRRGTGRTLILPTALPVAATLHVLTLWAWHAPFAYQAALDSRLVHDLEHATFLGTGLLLWGAALKQRGRPDLANAGAVLALFFVALAGSTLGGLMLFAPSPWYPAYAEGAAAWSITPLADQQMAALIMLMLGGVVYGASAVVLLVRWLDALDRRMRRTPPRTHVVTKAPRAAEDR